MENGFGNILVHSFIKINMYIQCYLDSNRYTINLPTRQKLKHTPKLISQGLKKYRVIEWVSQPPDKSNRTLFIGTEKCSS